MGFTIVKEPRHDTDHQTHLRLRSGPYRSVAHADRQRGMLLQQLP